jgi:hypothetical protein
VFEMFEKKHDSESDAAKEKSSVLSFDPGPDRFPAGPGHPSRLYALRAGSWARSEMIVSAID